MDDAEILPAGVSVRRLVPHVDARGTFIELFRGEWGLGLEPVQWNAVHSLPGVLRGVHVHVEHADYLTVVSGTMLLGLYDLRPESPTVGRSAMLSLTGEAPCGVTIPPGVCHGFCFPVASTHIYAVSEYWNLKDELGCRYDSAELDLRWPVAAPALSARDVAAPSFSAMRETFLAARAARDRNAGPA